MDVLLELILVPEALMILAGTYMAFRVARLADHPPTGWVLLTLSFGTAFLRAAIFLFAYSLPSDSQAPFIYAGQLLGLPIVVLVFFGVYYLYREFTKQLKEKQAAILTPQDSDS